VAALPQGFYATYQSIRRRISNRRHGGPQRHRPRRQNQSVFRPTAQNPKGALGILWSGNSDIEEVSPADIGATLHNHGGRGANVLPVTKIRVEEFLGVQGFRPSFRAEVPWRREAAIGHCRVSDRGTNSDLSASVLPYRVTTSAPTLRRSTTLLVDVTADGIGSN
jgi:hypothetical protein